MISSTPAATLTTSAADTTAPLHRAWRHRFACLHVAATWILLIAGASVTSHDAGLAEPDYPTGLGHWNYLAVHWDGLFQGLVRFEHGHREIAMVIGLLTIVETIWLWRTAERKALRVLGVLLLVGVLLQGALGGATVLLKLPPATSIGHGLLAQTFFCLSIATAFVLSAEWQRTSLAPATPTSRVLQRTAIAAAATVYVQLFLGALVRHTVAKERVPTFTDGPVLVHAGFAAAVVAAIGLLVARLVSHHGSEPRLVRPAFLLGALVVPQLLLGLLAMATSTDPLVTELHVITGATILGVAVLLVLRSFRQPRPVAWIRP